MYDKYVKKHERAIKDTSEALEKSGIFAPH